MTLFASPVFPPGVSSRLSQVVCVRFPKPALLIWANIVIPAGEKKKTNRSASDGESNLSSVGWETFISV